MRKFLVSALFALVAVVVSSCCGCRKAQSVALAGNTWSLVEIDGKVIDRGEDSTSYTLTLTADGKINGKGDCNRYFGGYKLENKNEIDIDNVGSTRMMCPNQQAEDKFFRILDDADKYKIDGNYLMLIDDSKVIATFKKLQ